MMEVAMTATAIRHSLTTLVAVALAALFSMTATTIAQSGSKKPTNIKRIQHHHDELVTGTKGLTTKNTSSKSHHLDTERKNLSTEAH
jgi:hypothetical protein